MTQNYRGDLGAVLKAAQAELPPRLKSRLLAISHLPAPVTFWDLRWGLPAIVLTPPAAWLVVTRAAVVTDYLALKMTGLAVNLTLPVMPAPTLVSVGAGLAAVMLGVGLATWMYLRAQDRNDQLFARSLAGG